METEMGFMKLQCAHKKKKLEGNKSRDGSKAVFSDLSSFLPPIWD